MTSPICVKCSKKTTRKKSGVTVVYMFSVPAQPYQAYQADLHECPECKQKIIAGQAMVPFWEHFYDETIPPYMPNVYDPNVYIVYE